MSCASKTSDAVAGADNFAKISYSSGSHSAVHSSKGINPYSVVHPMAAVADSCGDMMKVGDDLEPTPLQKESQVRFVMPEEIPLGHECMMQMLPENQKIKNF